MHLGGTAENSLCRKQNKARINEQSFSFEPEPLDSIDDKEIK